MSSANNERSNIMQCLNPYSTGRYSVSLGFGGCKGYVGMS